MTAHGSITAGSTFAALPDIGYSGVRLYSTSGNGHPADFAILQGATFFRALARGKIMASSQGR